jgi:hypothetical protein
VRPGNFFDCVPLRALQPTGDQRPFVFDSASLDAPVLRTLQMELDEDLLVRSVKRGGLADAQGIQPGMRLVSVNGCSLLGETLDDTILKLDDTAKPWQLVLERMAGKDDTGRTLFQLVQQIKKDVSSPPSSAASQQIICEIGGDHVLHNQFC